MLFKTFHEEKTLAQIDLHFWSQVDELRQKLEQKNKLIEKKTQEALLVKSPFQFLQYFNFSSSVSWSVPLSLSSVL